MSPTTVDAEGFLIAKSGAILGRLSGTGIVALWDKRTKSEVTLTMMELLQLWVQAEMQKEREESHEPVSRARHEDDHRL